MLSFGAQIVGFGVWGFNRLLDSGFGAQASEFGFRPPI